MVDFLMYFANLYQFSFNFVYPMLKWLVGGVIYPIPNQLQRICDDRNVHAIVQLFLSKFLWLSFETYQMVLKICSNVFVLGKHADYKLLQHNIFQGSTCTHCMRMSTYFAISPFRMQFRHKIYTIEGFKEEQLCIWKSILECLLYYMYLFHLIKFFSGPFIYEEKQDIYQYYIVDSKIPPTNCSRCSLQSLLCLQ